MRTIRKIVFHCTAGNPQNTAQEVVDYHTRPKSRGGLGWSKPGYHYIVEADGKIVNTWPEESPSNGVTGHNADSIHVCYTGGIDLAGGKPYKGKDTRTAAQKESLLKLARMLHKKYPEAALLGHRDLAAKECPCYDVRSEYTSIER